MDSPCFFTSFTLTLTCVPAPYHPTCSAFNRTRHPPELRRVFCWKSAGILPRSSRKFSWNSPGLLILLRWVLFRGSHRLQMLLKALYMYLLLGKNHQVITALHTKISVILNPWSLILYSRILHFDWVASVNFLFSGTVPVHCSLKSLKWNECTFINKHTSLAHTLHSCAVILWYLGQPEGVWCMSNLPVKWPRPSQPGVGHDFTLFEGICFFIELLLRGVLGDLSESQSVWDVSDGVWIFFGRPRFFWTVPELDDCIVDSSMSADGHSWQIPGPRWTPFSFRATHDEWSPLSQVAQVSSSTCWRQWECLTLYKTLRSKFKFSFVARTHFL